MNREEFCSATRKLGLAQTDELAHIWIHWAEECVDAGQYVDFTEKEKDVAVGEWLDRLYDSLYFIKRDLGKAAKQVWELADIRSCLYPMKCVLRLNTYKRVATGMKFAISLRTEH